MPENLCISARAAACSLVKRTCTPPIVFIISPHFSTGDVFSAEYDAWGKQTVSVNTIGLIRGYGSHEMLNEFCLINMNGRVYDPVLG